MTNRPASFCKIYTFFTVLVTVLTVNAAHASSGASRNSIDIQTGGAQNFSMPLKFEQGAYQKQMRGEYSTRPFGPGAAPYYNIRYKRVMSEGIWGLDNTWWSIELLHHKVWLDNLPPEVTEFRMTFGYNLIPFTLGTRLNSWLSVYSGLGLIVVHAVNTVNGLTLPNEPVTWPTGKRYSLVGAGIQVGAEARYNLWKNIFTTADLRFMYSRANVPIVGGRARVQQASLHAQAGLGVAW